MEHIISTEGIGAEYVTFYTDASADDAGKPCQISGNDTVSACAAGGKICGIIRSVKNGTACVQIAGFCRVSYTGDTAPEVGFCKLAADGAGNVCTNSDGREMLVVYVDAAAKTADIRL